MDEAIDTANAIASEHLEIVTANPFDVMTKIRNAGAIFIGEYSEPLRRLFCRTKPCTSNKWNSKILLTTLVWMISLRNQVSSTIQEKH